MRIRDLEPSERPWLAQRLVERWGATSIARRGELVDAAWLPALVAEDGERSLAMATYLIDGEACELVTLDALTPGQGAGAALLDEVAARARAAGCARLWLITTNDNLRALAVYQRHGLRIVAVHPDAVDEIRARKPSIPVVGDHGIPVHDELELALDLTTDVGPRTTPDHRDTV
jgi:ribosomal protein S18 acetylase RimI-like enzyme